MVVGSLVVACIGGGSHHFGDAPPVYVALQPYHHPDDWAPITVAISSSSVQWTGAFQIAPTK